MWTRDASWPSIIDGATPVCMQDATLGQEFDPYCQKQGTAPNIGTRITSDVDSCNHNSKWVFNACNGIALHFSFAYEKWLVNGENEQNRRDVPLNLFWTLFIFYIINFRLYFNQGTRCL